MDNIFSILTCKPKVLTDWVEYFIQFEGEGLIDTKIFAQPYAYILFNSENSIEMSLLDKNIKSKKSIIEPITLSPFSVKAKINSDTIVFGAKIKSTFLYLLTGIPLNLLTGSIYNIDEIITDDTNELMESLNSLNSIENKARVTEQYLLSKLISYQENKSSDNYNALKYLTHSFYSVFNIDQLINELNVSHRTLNRHFLKYTGISPKAMLSLIRFSKTVDYAIKYNSFNLETLWNFGYCDYSHFSKDFKKYYGETFEKFKHDLKVGENIQVKPQKENLLLSEILIS